MFTHPVTKSVLLEEAPLVYEAQDLNVERCTKAAAATQNAIASSKTGKRAPRSPGLFSRGRHGTASSEEPGPVLSRSGVNTLAARPPTPAAAHPSALPSPPSSPSCVSDASRLFAGCQSPRASCCFLYYCTGEGNGTPLQYSCLENPMDGGAW